MSENAPVYIVSGLPRSGTSMMMQMLEAGGLPVLADFLREADDDNPRGYYEFEPVKKTRDDPSWLDDAAGKVVKMVYLLLYDLPADHHYKVVFMRRPLGEVLASQRAMLERTGNTGASLTDAQLTAAYEKEIEKIDAWLAQQPNFDVIDIAYPEAVSDPAKVAGKLNAFAAGALDEAAMVEAVKPELHRQKQSR